METYDQSQRQHFCRMNRHDLESFQANRLRELLGAIVPENSFYTTRLNGCRCIDWIAQIRDFPLLTKDDLLSAADESPARFHTYPADQYVRLHRTSGTRGRPLAIWDTARDWQWWIDTWQYVLDAAEVAPEDRAMMAFSFGPFIGFWSANDALVARGAMVIPGGGMSTASRLAFLMDTGATVLCCTPTYALHMAQVARDESIDIANSPVRCIIVAGEPGGSLPEVRQRIESQWQARVLDHSGATEVGPWGFGTADGTSLHVIETEFIAEFIRADGSPADENELSELVLTNLGRWGAPVIRYRTGDLVRPRRIHDDVCQFVRLEGGVLGRVDDMVVIRGVNIFPSSIERVIRSFPELGEFRIVLSNQGELDQVRVEVEAPCDDPERIAKQFEASIGLRIDVSVVPENSLPRFETKSRRVIDQRAAVDLV